MYVVRWTFFRRFEASPMYILFTTLEKIKDIVQFKYLSTSYRSFYRSKNVLSGSKFFESVQKFNCIEYLSMYLSKNFWACTKTKFTEWKSLLGVAQNVWDWPNMYINFWSIPKKFEPAQYIYIFWDLLSVKVR